MVLLHLAYPLASCAVVATLAAVVVRLLPPGPFYGQVFAMRWGLVPAGLALLLAVAPWLPRAWHLPGSGWARHLDLAGRWVRAGMAVRWSLTEAQALAILGTDLAPFAPVLGRSGAADHCARLAAWHMGAARRRLTATAATVAVLVLAAGGGIVLGSLRLWLGAA